MDKIDFDLKRVLEWSAENETVITLKIEDEVLFVRAVCENISSELLVDESYDAKALGNSVWAALVSVKHGTEYTQKYGYFPPARTTSAGIESKKS